MNLNLIQNNRSFVSFGDADPQLYQGQMNEYNMGESKFINIDFDHIEIGRSGEMRLSKALLDTGNTCISIPHRYEAKILRGFNTKVNNCAFQVEEHVPMFSLLICRI